MTMFSTHVLILFCAVVAAFHTPAMADAQNAATCSLQECTQTMFENNLDTPTNTSFRLSVTDSKLYFSDSRLSKDLHQFNLTVPDESKGTLYLVNEPAEEGSGEISLTKQSFDPVDANNFANFNRTALKTGDILKAYDSKAVSEKVTIVTRVLEWVPALNHFNALDAGDGTLDFKYATGSSIVSECENDEGCPELIVYSYVYKDPVAPTTPVPGRVKVFVKASRTTFDNSMLTVPSQYGLNTPLQVEYLSDVIWFGSNSTELRANIQINSLDSDTEMINVTIRMESPAKDLLLYVNPRIDSNFPIGEFVKDKWIQFFDCIPWEVECDTTRSIAMRGYPSIINKFLDNMYAKVLSQNSIQIFVEVHQDGQANLVSKNFFMSSESAIVRPVASTPTSALTSAPTVSVTQTKEPNNDDVEVENGDVNTAYIVAYVAGGLGFVTAGVALVVVVMTRRKARSDLLPQDRAPVNRKLSI